MDAASLRKLFVLANEFKEGDLLVGGTADAGVRRDAKAALGGLHVGDIDRTALVEDAVTEALARSIDRTSAADLGGLTIAGLRSLLLSPAASEWVSRHRAGLSSEVIAAVVKTMSDDDLAFVAQTIFNPLPEAPVPSHQPGTARGVAIGSRRHFGSRIQPNSPGDDEREILFSTLEALTYGCGDVIIGVNPASDDVDTIVRLEQLLQRIVERLQLPTRYAVLSDILKQTTARGRTRVDVGFQSLAGTARALGGMVGLDVDGLAELCRGFDGLYFETGQGSAVTNGTAEDVDMVTLESRAYGVARHLREKTGAWTIVNDVAGFIGPEVFRTGEQLRRACLEDIAMAKLHGLTMGLDVCATFHMGIAPAGLHELTADIVERGAPAYLMAVAGNADPMLGYLTTSFREHPRARQQTGRQLASAMQRRLMNLGVMSAAGRPEPTPAATAHLYALYCRAGGDLRSHDELRVEGERAVQRLRTDGFDIGYGCTPDFDAPAGVTSRLDGLYRHARIALFARVADGVVDDACPAHVRVRTIAAGRDDYLAHPPAGEAICREDIGRILALARGAPVQIVVSDGLNANAVNENLRAVMLPLRRLLAGNGTAPADVDVVVENGRVRAGYHVGELLEPDVVIHFIGERPGTGLNTLSAYITYGRHPGGASRWRTSLDHSCTTAICGIHPKGKRPDAAADEIARAVRRILVERCSGVALGRSVAP